MMAKVEVTNKQKLIIDRINSLTKLQAYGKIEIVIRKGQLTDITVSENIKVLDEREEPRSSTLVK